MPDLHVPRLRTPWMNPEGLDGLVPPPFELERLGAVPRGQQATPVMACGSPPTLGAQTPPESVDFSSGHEGGCVQTIEKENFMRFKKQLAVAVAATGMTLTVFAQTGAGPGMGGMGPNMGRMNPEMHNRMDTHMRAMQDVRARMSTATTPEQKQALMDEHMRLMDEHMSHMQSMRASSRSWSGGAAGASSMPSDMYSPGSVL